MNLTNFTTSFASELAGSQCPTLSGYVMGMTSMSMNIWKILFLIFGIAFAKKVMDVAWDYIKSKWRKEE